MVRNIRKENILELIKKRAIVLDGASGTELQKKGMPTDICPEVWAMSNPEVLMAVQAEYIKAGADVLYTFTFGGTSAKLKQYGYEGKAYEINKTLAMFTRQVAKDQAFVAGDLAPTGLMIEPLGEVPFEEIVDIYKEQVRALVDGGVDLFVIETMLDIQEARAAVIAVKETCDLPVMVSMTYEANGKTLTGTDPATAMITLQSLGADIVGCNCSTGPDKMIEFIKQMRPFAKVPIIAKPNAGLPVLIEGKTTFDMDSMTFAGFAQKLVEEGVSVIGGCCGTTPEFISKISYLKEEGYRLRETADITFDLNECSVLSSSQKYVTMGPTEPLRIVGERINPTGKKKMQESLKAKDYSLVHQFAKEQKEDGADILDVNVGTNGLDEEETMVNVINRLTSVVDLPLVIDSSYINVIERALRIYPGRALVNSISLESEKIEKLLPIAAKYGAMILALPLSDNGLPKNQLEKREIIEGIYKEASKYGYTKKDIVVDGLVLTISSDQNAAKDVCDTIKWCTDEFGVNTIVGLSNISFGLPNRGYVNATFLSSCMLNGLSMAIANPSSDLLMETKRSVEVLNGKDVNCKHFIEASKKTKKDRPIVSLAQSPVYNGIIEGEKEKIVAYIKDAMNDEALVAKQVVEELMIPAITKVGDYFEDGSYFLPQLILSAEAMVEGFNYIEPMLEADLGGTRKTKPKIVLATVKGDIHDIGKNIVGLMMKNHGFEVIDLGKDVDTEIIIAKAKEVDADLIGLSALMTTTMMNMVGVIEKVKENGLRAKVMIGGAVITESFAEEIGADGYSKDANEAVKLAKKLLAI